MELVSSIFAALVWLAIIAALGACAYWFWRAVLEGSRGERALLLGGALCVVAACVFPASVGDYRSDEALSVFITAHWVVWAVRGLAAAAFIAAAISSKISGRRRGLRAAVLALFVFGPFSECARFASDPAPWQQYCALEHPSGARYAYIESSFLQGQLLSIARVESERWYGTSYEGLVTTNGDSPRSYVSLVRPFTSSESRYGQLHLVADGRVVAVRSRNHAYMAFDPKTDGRWSHEEIYELSPFLLLDAQAKPHDEDVRLIVKAISDVANRYTGDRAWLLGALEQGTISGIPSAKHLESALKHPNPAARAIAQQLLTELRQQQQLLAAQSAQP